MWAQYQLTLSAKARGFHLITDEIERCMRDLAKVNIGLVNILIQHTSASLTINENADPSVRTDFESYFSRLAKEDEPYYIHTYEGSDDMPAHLKASILGASLNIPVTNGRLNLGTWQGIYLCEHRNHGGRRNLIITLQGE